MAPKDVPVLAPQAAPPLISLLSSADVIPEAEGRWESGITYETEVCGDEATGAFAPCDAGSLTFTSNSSTPELEPFGIFAGDKCSSWGLYSRDWQGRARRKLAACESAKIASELWRGDIARDQGWTNPFFADDTQTDILSDTSLTPLDAFACLEQSLAECNCGSRGMIHATPQVVTHWANLNLIDREEVNIAGRGRLTRLVSKLGTIVVPDAGYDGSGPGDPNPLPAASGAVWAYATSMIHIRLSPVMVVPEEHAQALNRQTNLLEYRAERLVVAGFDCCAAAIPVAIDLCEIGGS